MERLFQYAVILQPTEEGRDERGERAKIIVPLDTVLAKDENEVRIVASRKIPEEYLGNLDRVEVAVRPF